VNGNRNGFQLRVIPGYCRGRDHRARRQRPQRLSASARRAGWRTSAVRRRPRCEAHTNALWQKHRQAPQLYNHPTPQSSRMAPQQTTRRPWRNPKLSLSLRGMSASPATPSRGQRWPPLAPDSDPFHSSRAQNLTHKHARDAAAMDSVLCQNESPPSIAAGHHLCYHRMSVSKYFPHNTNLATLTAFTARITPCARQPRR
jgi:hypothetical protein